VCIPHCCDFIRLDPEFGAHFRPGGGTSFRNNRLYGVFLLVAAKFRA
jgi:hypothetical protein